jgi:hypothetical protein
MPRAPSLCVCFVFFSAIWYYVILCLLLQFWCLIFLDWHVSCWQYMTKLYVLLVSTHSLCITCCVCLLKKRKLRLKPHHKSIWWMPLGYKRKHWQQYKVDVATPLSAKCEGEGHTPKSGKLESSGTPENSKRDCRGQISSHLSALGVIGKVLKCRCPKWPRMSHLDICSPSYGQKKGRESNCQFDSRPLKVRNRPVLNVRSGSATRRWKALFEVYKIGSDLVLIRGRGEELWLSKVPGVQPGHIWDNFGTPLRESQENVTFGCHSHGRTQNIL